LAGRVKDKFPNDIEVETVYSGFLGFGHKGDTIRPPNIAVDDKLLGSEPSFEDIEKAFMEKRRKG
jgi:hypothetical protein